MKLITNILARLGLATKDEPVEAKKRERQQEPRVEQPVDRPLRTTPPPVRTSSPPADTQAAGLDPTTAFLVIAATGGPSPEPSAACSTPDTSPTISLGGGGYDSGTTTSTSDGGCITSDMSVELRSYKLAM